MGGSLFTKLPRTNIQSYQLILLNFLQWLVGRKFLFTIHSTERIPSLRCPTQQLYACTFFTVDPFSSRHRLPTTLDFQKRHEPHLLAMQENFADGKWKIVYKGQYHSLCSPPLHAYRAIQ